MGEQLGEIENRVEQWKRNLLDLSLRNPLLNVRDGLKFLPMQPGAVYAATSNEPGIVPYAGSETASTRSRPPS